MLTEAGKVVEVRGEFALVDVTRKSACQSCSASKGCGTSVLANFFSKRFSHVKAMNDIGAKQGDEILLSMNENSLVLLTFLSYMVPLLMMMVFAIWSTWMGLADGLVVIVAGLGLITGFIFVKRILHKHIPKDRLYPVVMKIVSRTSEV